MAELLLSAVGLSSGYSGRAVIHDINFSVQPGEVVALLGPNGCGKTTILKTLCHALKPMLGSVSILGKPTTDMGFLEIARQVAYVPQKEDYSFDFNVKDLVLMGRLAHSESLYETRADLVSAQRAMDMTDCSELAERMVSELSGGEAQRALIARALAQETPILLCDEPTTHLDPRHQVEIGKVIQAIAGENKAVLIATHDLNWALQTCSRAIMLKNGRTLFDGTLSDAIESGVHEIVYETEFQKLQQGETLLLLPTGRQN